MMQTEDIANISSPLPWHAQVWSRLTAQLQAGQLPHALLLSGARYTGKSQLALALSRFLLCAQPQDGLNCGHCHACELSASGGHGDFRWVQPEEKSRVIKVDQIRELVQFSNKTAGFGARKVVVLAPADSMNTNAFNALLKALEEPAADTYLLLVCHRMHNVPATIRSRCQLLDLAVPDKDLSLSWLDQLTGGREASDKLLSLARGRPLLAQQLYLDDSAEELAARRLALHALLNGTADVPQVSDLWKVLETDELLEQLMEELQGILRMLPAERLRSTQGQAAFELLDEVAQLRRAVSAGSNPGKQLMLDALLSKCHRELGAGLLGDKI